MSLCQLVSLPLRSTPLLPSPSPRPPLLCSSPSPSPPTHLPCLQYKNSRRAFKQFDKLQSGKITIEQATTMLASLQLPIPESQLSAIVAIADVDRDGLLDFHELLRYLMADDPIVARDDVQVAPLSLASPSSSLPPTTPLAGDLNASYMPPTPFLLLPSPSLPSSDRKSVV